MHVLLTEASFGDADFLVQPLRDTGCRVSRCHNRAGLCRALVRTSACPLDERTDPPVLLVDVRGQGDALTAREFGTVCAVRAQVPIALVSPNPDVPAEVPAGLENRVTVIDVDGLLDTCRAAARYGGDPGTSG